MPGPQNHSEALEWLHQARRLLKKNIIFINTRSKMGVDLSALEARMDEVRERAHPRELEFDATYMDLSVQAHEIEQGDDPLATKQARIEAVAAKVKDLLTEISGALAEQALYTQRLQQTDDHIVALNELTLYTKTYAQPLADLRQAAAAKGDAGQYADAAADLANVGALFAEQQRVATADHKADELYKKRKAAAEGHKNALEGRALGAKTYHQPLVDLLDSAGSLHDNLQFSAAAEALKDISALYKTQDATATADHKADELYKKRKAVAEGYVHELQLLKLNDQTYEGPIVAALATAKQKHDESKFLEAPTALENIAALLKTQKKAAATDRENAVADARYKAVYVDTLQQLAEAIGELTPLPGAAKEVKALQDLKSQGAQVAGPGKYKEACKALGALPGLLERGRQAAASFTGEAGNPEFQVARAAAEAALGEYRSRFQLSKPKTVQTHESEYTTILKTLEGSPAPSVIQTAIGQMVTLKTTLEQESAAAKTAEGKCVEAAATAHALVKEVQLYTQADVFKPLFKQYRHAQALQSILDFDQAKDAYQDLNASLVQAIQQHKPAYDAWKATQKKALAGPVTKLDEIRSTYDSSYFADLPANCRGKTYNPSALYALYRATETEVIVKHDYAQATVVAQAVLDTVAEPGGAFTARVRAIGENKANLDAADLVVHAARQKAEDAIARLEGQQGDPAPFRSRLEAPGHAWFSAKQTNILSGNALAAARDTAVSAFQAIEADVIAIIGDGGENAGDAAKLDQSKAEAATAKVLSDLDSAWKEADRAFATATRGDLTLTTEWNNLRAALDAVASERAEALKLPVSTQTPGEWKRRDALAMLPLRTGSILDRIQVESKARAEQRDTVRQTVNRVAAEARDRIKALLKARARFAPYLQTVERQIEDLASMAASDVPAVVDSAMDRLKRGGEIDQLLMTLETPATFEDILSKKSQAKRLLEDKIFKEVSPDRVAALTTRYQEHIKPEMAKRPPRAALELVKAFHDAVNEEKMKARDLHQRRQQIKADTTTAEAELKKVTGAADLKKDLASQVEVLKKFTPGCETAYEIKVRALLATLASITAEGPEAQGRKDQMQKAVRQRELDAEVRTNNLQASLDVFDANLAKKAKAALDNTPADQVDARRHAAIGEARDAAAGHLKKGLIAEAQDSLDEAIRLANAFIADPFNKATANKRDLEKANSDYQTAVHAFARGVNDLKVEILAEADADATVADGPAAVQPLERLPTLFDVGKFSDVIAGLTSPSTVADRRRMRENVLRFVRVYQERFDKDPVLKTLAAGSPFKAQVPITPVKSALTQIEVSVLRLG